MDRLSAADLGTLLPSIDTTVVLVQGQNAKWPGHSAQQYFDMLHTPSKELV